MRYRSVFDTNFNVINSTNQLCMWSKCYPNCILFIEHSKRQPYIVDSKHINIFQLRSISRSITESKNQKEKKNWTNDHHYKTIPIKHFGRNKRQMKHWHIRCKCDCMCARWPKLWFLFLTKFSVCEQRKCLPFRNDRCDLEFVKFFFAQHFFFVNKTSFITTNYKSTKKKEENHIHSEIELTGLKILAVHRRGEK